MKMTFLLIVLVGLFLGTQSTSPACPSNYMWNSGCIKLCTHPDFSKCGDVFPAIYNPSFCALERSGRWVSETFACAACKRPDVIGVKDGKCSCLEQGCPSGQQCKNGKCQQIQLPPVLPPTPGNCGIVPCKPGWKCVYGRCIPPVGQCSSSSDCESYEICLEGKCVDRCATLRCSSGYICIRGQCVPAPRQCTYPYECPRGMTCTNGKCVDKCQGVICIATTRCIDGQCVPLCENVRCDPGFQCFNGACQPIPNYCSSTSQCKINEICHLNRCVNYCSITECPPGSICSGNRCVPLNSCTSNSQCPYGKICKNGQCIDLCDRILCPPNTKCVFGNCVPLSGYCYSNNQCPAGQICAANGRCEDKCALIDCAPGYICSNGGCYPSGECTYDYQCSSDKKCVNRYCVDKCSNVVCPFGTVCQGGSCVRVNPCAAVSCIEGSRCQNGVCIPIYPTCFKDSDCKDTETCNQNKCNDRCIFMKCSSGYICQYSQCIPLCSKILCPLGTTCIEGKCVTSTNNYCRVDSDCKSDQTCLRGRCISKCSKINCPKGSYCFDGECRLELDVCPVDSDYQATVCTEPRPTIKNCPMLYYIVAPTPNVCGVRSDGTRSNFVRFCQACMDTTVDYYFNAPCHQVPFVCGPNEKCLDYYCSSSGCRNSDQCQYDWQICVGGRCVDRCSILKCRDCKFGKCAYIEPYGDCRVDSDCKDESWSCFGWKCVDLCKNQKCKPNERCLKGECVPILRKP